MAERFRQKKDGGGCCNCDKQETACAGCKDCADAVSVTLSKRKGSNYGTKCGMRHPFLEYGGFPPRFFRDVSVEFSVSYSITDYVLSGGAYEPAQFTADCTINVSVNDCATLESASWSSSYSANWWYDAVTDGADSSSGGSQTDQRPWARPDGPSVCWTAEQILGSGSVGQPVRYLNGEIVSGIMTGDYDFGDIGGFVVPPPTLFYKTQNGEVWARLNSGTLDSARDGWGWRMNTVLQGPGEIQIVAVRSAKGRCIVELDNEFTTEQLIEEVKAGLVWTEWGGTADNCAEEELSNYSDSYSYSELQFKFVYDYSVKVRIGYKIYVSGHADEAPVQYVDSPGARVFTIFPAGHRRCVSFVSATTCL